MTPAPTFKQPGFRAASRLARVVPPMLKGRPRAVLRAGRHPSDWVATYRFVRGLPRVDVVLGDTEAGRRLRGKMVSRLPFTDSWGVAQAVLEIPPTDKEYLSGRRKQALRTNLNRVKDLGCTCRVVGPEEIERVWDRLRYRPGRKPLLRQRLGLPGQITMVAEDPEGIIGCIAAVTIDGEWARLDVFKKPDAGDRFSLVRFQLHVFIVRELRDRGVHFLTTGSALAVRDKLQYQHHIMGFEPVNLRIVSGPVGRDRKRGSPHAGTHTDDEGDLVLTDA